MALVLDLDQLRTFVKIAETGSFTKAAEQVHKTQSAVSMQMRRLEDTVGRPLFGRDGRNSRLTEDGEKLLSYARRLLKLNSETLSAFDDSELSGRARLGTPDDYADRFLPEILVRFAESHPRVEVTVVCAPTEELISMIDRNELDVAIVTNCTDKHRSGSIRREPLLWVGSARHSAHAEDVLPLALGRPTCAWRMTALDALAQIGRRHRILYSSWNSSAVAAAVTAGLAVTILPESALRPGMRVLSEAEGFPRLPDCNIGMIRGINAASGPTAALAQHIISSLDNLSVALAAE
jgi:DNA-binding transcriptional LysR family regulator